MGPLRTFRFVRPQTIIRSFIVGLRNVAMRRLVYTTGMLLCVGCGSFLGPLRGPAPPPLIIPNPAAIPARDDQFVWLQAVDVVDDYFRIVTEQPVQNRDGLLLEGRIETAYRIGASYFEPWRRDTTPGFERLQSSLQTIRRRAIVSVRPNGGGYDIEVIVLKELEDVDRSQRSGAAAATQRHDGTIVRTDSIVDAEQTTLGWIPQGRDPSLEQVILRDIVGRITGPEVKKKHLHH